MTLAYPVKQLGELCDVLDSKRRPITKRDRIEGEFPYYGATGILGYVEGFIFDEPLVLIGEDGAKWGAGENTAFSAEGRYWVNNHAHVIRPHRHKVLDAWLIYQLNQADLTEFITGLTVPKLNQARMREIPIIVPPLDEQRRIVAVLDKAFAGIATATANAQKNLTNARALFEARLGEVFSSRNAGWRDTKISQISEVSYGYTEKASFEPIGPKFLRITDIQEGEVSWEKVPNCPISEKDFRRQKLENGDIVFARTGATTGKSFLIDNPPDAVAASYLIRLRISNNEVLPEFVQLFFQTPQYWKVVNEGTSGSAQGGFNASKLADMHLPVPTLEEQRTAVEKLSIANRQRLELQRLYANKVEALNELKQSLLQKAFAGELT